jgi:hypothetical protein
VSQARYDGKTGRPLFPQTQEERLEDIRRTIEANRRHLRDQVWWRRWRRAAVDRFWLLMEHRRWRVRP